RPHPAHPRCGGPAPRLGGCAPRDAGGGEGLRLSPAELVARLRALAETGVGPSGDLRPSGPLDREAASPTGSDEPRTRTLRVSLETLDRILDLTGEIAVGRERLRGALDAGASPAMAAAEIHRESDRLHADLQELVMKARMEPLGPTFRRLTRTVRDLGRAL